MLKHNSQDLESEGIDDVFSDDVPLTSANMEKEEILLADEFTKMATMAFGLVEEVKTSGLESMTVEQPPKEESSIRLPIQMPRVNQTNDQLLVEEEAFLNIPVTDFYESFALPIQNSFSPVIYSDLGLLANFDFDGSFDEIENLINLLRHYLRRVSLSPEARKKIEEILTRIGAILTAARSQGLTSAARLQLKIAIEALYSELFSRTITAKTRNLRVLAEIYRRLMQILVSEAGAATIAFAIKFFLIVLVAYLSHIFAKWAYNQPIPGRGKQTFFDFYSDLIFEIFYSDRINCKKLQEEIDRRRKHTKRLQKWRQILTSDKELKANAIALIKEITILIDIIDRALDSNICDKALKKRPLEILRKQLIKEKQVVVDEL